MPSVDPALAAFVTVELRAVTHTDTTVRDRRPLAVDMVVETCLDDAVDAQALLDALWPLYSADRDRYTVRAYGWQHRTALGGTVSVDGARWFDADRRFLQVGLAEVAGEGGGFADITIEGPR